MTFDDIPEADRRSLQGCVVSIATHPNVAYAVRGIAARLGELGCEVVLMAPPYDTPPASTRVLMTCAAFACGREVIDRLPRLQGIAALASGTENIDIDAADERAIVVAHAPTPANVTSMAEATVMLVLAALYRLDRSTQELRNGWRSSEEPFARTLSGKTLGLVGFGKIAAAVALRLQAWDVRVLASTHREKPENLPVHVRRVKLDELLASSDVISLHGRPDASSKALIDAGTLTLLKPGAVLINTARGALIDEAALVRGLESGQPAFAALDSFRVEPLASESPLRRLDNVILTPHMVGHTREVQDSLVRQGVLNVVDIMNARTPEFVRNPEVLPQWQGRLAVPSNAR